ncbi:MAG: hypothetical protein CFE37_11110 [Alphaproteobacteria bacterium PA4]|nr:MAG: hypothetical protein CFE37_11110 [Alphaproteobacteria bacterium PA4]
MTGKTRTPLLLSLVPLIAGIGLYFWLWNGWAADFAATLRPWLPGSSFSVTGFPYRMEANVTAPRWQGGDAVALTASADSARINRGPWQPDLTVIASEGPRFAARISPALRVSITGGSAASSVHSTGGRLVRLSNVIAQANVQLGFLPAALTADTLELHLRERLGAAAPGSPTGPVRGQLVLAATHLRIGGGGPLALAADLAVTGPARLTAYDRWAASGTIEIASLTLSDATGEVASGKATLVPLGRTGFRLAGTVATVCPASVAAALTGRPPVSERRLRAPVSLAFEGSHAGLTVTGVPADLAMRATRGQLPPCPVLRGNG